MKTESAMMETKSQPALYRQLTGYGSSGFRKQHGKLWKGDTWNRILVWIRQAYYTGVIIICMRLQCDLGNHR